MLIPHMKNLNTLAKEFINVIGSESIDTIKEIAEIGMDKFLEEGIGKDIPLINILVAIWKSGIAVQNQLFLNKVANYLNELKGISVEDRQKFLKKIREENKEEKLGETILLILDKSDEIQKPVIIGAIMKRFILDEISERDALRLCYIVNKVFLEDLFWLPAFIEERKVLRNEIADNLYTNGLLIQTGIDYGTIGNDNAGGETYELNKVGFLLDDVIFETGIFGHDYRIKTDISAHNDK